MTGQVLIGGESPAREVSQDSWGFHRKYLCKGM